MIRILNINVNKKRKTVSEGTNNMKIILIVYFDKVKPFGFSAGSISNMSQMSNISVSASSINGKEFALFQFLVWVDLQTCIRRWKIIYKSVYVKPHFYRFKENFKLTELCLFNDFVHI